MSGTGLPSSTRRAIAALPAAFALHLAEEWFGGFTHWTAAVLGSGVGSGRFLLINVVAFPVIAACAIASLRFARVTWLAATLATLFALNGALHLLATLAFGQYSPGTATGVLLYLPLGAFVLRSLSRHLSAVKLYGAAALGIASHAAVAGLAFM